MSKEMITYKILLLGDSSVGKTAFILRFCEGKFEDDSLTTIGLDSKTKFVSRQDKKIQLQIWDTAGQERFRSLSKSWYKGADGILLMYDISNYETFKHIKNWIGDIKNNISVAWEKLALIVIGNKSDLPPEKKKVDKKDIEELENIVIELENNVTYNKEDKIDEEKARKIIETKYPKYAHYADSIITHFKDRRKTIKNSLLRKKWKKNTTFQKRRNDKIKIRKNIQNLKEPLNKIVESQTFCKNNVLPIINCLFMKEKLNKNLIKINELIFLTESNKIKNIKTPENRLKDYNILKENIQCRKNSKRLYRNI